MPRNREEADLFFCSVTPLQNVRNENIEEGKVQKRTVRGTLTQARIIMHFDASGCNGIMSLFVAVRESGQEYSVARELVVDIDCHDAKADRVATQKAALTWYKAAVKLGLRPILENSSINSYHLRIIFNREVEAGKVRSLGLWLTRDWKNYGLSQGPEIFPKQDNLTEQGSEHRSFGSAVRIFGRNPAFEFWSAIYDGKTWLEGDAAIDFILAVQGDNPGLIPVDAARWKEERADRVRKPRDDAKRDIDRDVHEAERALTYLDGDYVNDRASWLQIGFALFDLGDRGLPLWEEWSKGSSKFVDGECQRFWQGFHSASGEDDTTIATLFYYAKQKGWRPESSGKKGEDYPTQSKILLRIIKEFDTELFHDKDGRNYAAIRVKDHMEVHPLKSKAFKDWLTGKFYKEANKPVSNEAYQSVLGVLEAQARWDGETKLVCVRVGEHDGKIYVDLGDDSWQVVEIDSAGCRLIADSPVCFRRPRGLEAMPLPVFGSSILDLKDLLNIDDTAFLFLVTWEAAAIRPVGPYPVLVVTGEQGSAKTTLCEIARMMTDPHASLTRSAPRDIRDLFVAAVNNRVLAFNNVSEIPQSISDAICCLVEGGGFGAREHYEMDVELILRAQLPVILNGIVDFIGDKHDLEDRAVRLNLPAIPGEKRREKREVWAAFQSKLPELLGALFDLVSKALRLLPSINPQSKPRMADFAVFGEAVSQALGNPPDKFLDAYKVNQKSSVEASLADDRVAIAIRELVEKEGGEWTGTSAKLLSDLNNLVGEQATRCQDWPKTPRGMSGRLRRLIPLFRMVGLLVDFSEEGHDKKKTWLLKSLGKTQPAQPAQGKPSKTEDESAGCQNGQADSTARTDLQQPADSNGPPDSTARNLTPTARTSEQPPAANPGKQASADGAGGAGGCSGTQSRDVGGSEGSEAEATPEPTPLWKKVNQTFLGHPYARDDNPPF